MITSITDIIPAALKMEDGGEATTAAVINTTSHVNGRGLWSSWQRNFTSPELALLDLFDNCVDATLHEKFQGNIQISQDNTGGISMQNNCRRCIPPVEKVLEVFSSCKGGDEIGENGVGIKQACAALSDLAIVVTKNERLISVGIINKALQTEDGVCLPSFEFRREVLHADLDRAFQTNEAFQVSIQHYGNGDIDEGRRLLEAHFDTLLNCEYNHVFFLVLHRVHQRSTGGGIPRLLRNLREILPRNYLHVPPKFKVMVDAEPVVFQFWEKRLAELHVFPSICIDPKHSFELAMDWHYPNNGHTVSMYVGFDPIRANVSNKNKAALLIYSRKSGRLVREIEDARGMLGLATGGTDFGQGLTVIIDDHVGCLPLTPTKQDIAFGNEIAGKIHETNLTSWIGAFTHVYYQHFLGKFGTKSSLGDEVKSHEQEVEHAFKRNTVVSDLQTLRHGNFSTGSGISFSRGISKGKIRCVNKKSNRWVSGKATLINFRKVAPSVPPKRAIKRKDPDSSTSPLVTPTKKVTRTKAFSRNMLTILDDDSASSSDEGPKQDDALLAEVSFLRVKCQQQDSQLEKMEAKIAAYKVHMQNLRQANESLQRLADL
eukprot:CAMPEP_0119009490 /NCGR_PEP_ID=MMETSP1176-20130426/4400_1 /TAXON_ID=265551 /ORGANISM="Synedropsis recta cf, Strain CCMP1620" /LENGTH=600 /DNA_ID=CAMNT_0006962013 /DNA_START=95 /DNA_END=1897 /DNA_ORIENTATION=-